MFWKHLQQSLYKLEINQTLDAHTAGETPTSVTSFFFRSAWIAMEDLRQSFMVSYMRIIGVGSCIDWKYLQRLLLGLTRTNLSRHGGCSTSAVHQNEFRAVWNREDVKTVGKHGRTVEHMKTQAKHGKNKGFHT